MNFSKFFQNFNRNERLCKIFFRLVTTRKIPKVRVFFLKRIELIGKIFLEQFQNRREKGEKGRML